MDQPGLLVDRATPPETFSRSNSVDTTYSNIHESFVDSTKMHTHDHNIASLSQASGSSQSTVLSSLLSHTESVRTPPSSMPEDPRECPASVKSMDIMRDVLMRNYQTGVRISVFTEDIQTLRHAMDMHGLPSLGLDLYECRKTLLSHLLMGHCISRDDEVHSLPRRPDRTACRCISSDYESVRDLATAMFDIVLSASTQSISTDRLVIIARSLDIPRLCDIPKANVRRNIIKAIELAKQSICDVVSATAFPSVEAMFKNFERMSKPTLIALAAQHNLRVAPWSDRDTLRDLIAVHIGTGKCAKPNGGDAPGCATVVNDCENYTAQPDLDADEATIALLELSSKKLSYGPLERLLKARNVPYSVDRGVSSLRRAMKQHIRELKKGKRSVNRREDQEKLHREQERRMDDIRRQWPQLVPHRLKDKVVKMFRKLTSKETLASFTCASCAEECLNREQQVVELDDLDLDLLRRPDFRVGDDGDIVDTEWLDTSCNLPDFSSTNDPALNGILLDPLGLDTSEHGKKTAKLCRTCFSSLKCHKTPPMALANHAFLGEVPDELKDLTVVEEAMIARCRAKCWVIQLKEDNQDLALPHSQRGMKGHIIVYPQRPSDIASVLPPPMEEISAPICVIFVGSTPPSDEWIREKAKPLTVRRDKVRNALIWLQKHNRHYKDITIDYGALERMDENQILPVHVERLVPDHIEDSLTARYDPSEPLANNQAVSESSSSASRGGNSVPFQNVVVTDVDGHAPSNELRAAAVRHVKKKGGGYIEVPHDPKPVDEFFNPDMFPMIYPTLFPYGIGGFEDCNRSTKLSMKRHIKHLFSLRDRRFQEHYSFLFTAFNILQRRAVLLHSSLKVKRSNFDSIAADFASVSPEAVHVVSERVSRGDFATANSDEERKVLKLMNEVKVVTSHVPGSSASRVAMRNEIRGLMMDQGLPSFYITINPADVFNPLVKFLAGSDIDIDNLLPEQVPDYWEQSYLVARNPAVAAKFFNIYMKAFISAILGYDADKKNDDGGILGHVKAYYGCVEAQGRGTLHCHMMVWVEGGLNPNEIKKRVLEDGDTDFRDRLLAFLDDTIHNCVPDNPGPNITVPSSRHHPCSVRGINPNSSDADLEILRQKDLHQLVRQCQSHTHSGTCYKYWKGPPEPRECRFDLNESNFRSESSFDPETGEICLRCLDGLVNNFNATILEAIRCNMDIKFIGSGASAKAILYYITDYITKSQLKAHVAYAALDLAVSKLGEYDPTEDDFTMRAKRLLQKCAYSMISHQELSSQQVCSYLMDFEDHFTSHKYNNIYWTSFEKLINDEDPCDECYRSAEPKPVTLNDQSDDSDEDSDKSDDGDSGSESDDSELNRFIDDEWEEEIELADDDVAVAVKSDGELIAKAAQVADYQLRSEALNDLCVWDCIAQAEKIKKTTRKDTEDEYEDELNELDDMDDMEAEADEPIGGILDGHHSIDEILAIRTHKRPRAEFLPDHVEATSHVLKINKPQNRRVPVPIGPSIPRRDREELKERYSRLMLIFFKPWRHAKDLRRQNQPWHEAFQEFLEVCPRRFTKVMDNMQILHECRDSRDDHFADRRNRGRSRAGRISQEYMSRSGVADDFGYGDEEDVLEHLQSIANVHSGRKAESRYHVLKCLKHVQKSGMYGQSIAASNAEIDSNTFSEDITNQPTFLEDVWQKAYDDRRDQWKKKSSSQPAVSGTTAPVPSTEQAAHRPVIRDGSAFRNPHNEPEVRIPAIRQQLEASDPEVDVNISEMVQKWTLNTEQARAFKIVAEHSLTVGQDPLRMYLGGPGGTGKSRVINALKDYFELRNQSRRFRLASYTGVAAKNINGMTLHSALCINQRSKGGSQGRTRRDLVAMWEGVDYLFIDEVSMIGCSFLLKISEALTEAKQSTKAFGGINIIFAGDFAQLPPVGETRLFSHIDTRKKRVGTKRGQDDVFGKLLWLSVKVVVILTEVMRQSGPENERFTELLSRLREGKCTDDDYELLNSRIIKNVNPDWSDPKWHGLPVIVSGNDVKDALNEEATKAFARQTGRQMHWYYATDMRGGTEIGDEDLKTHLRGLHSGKTSYRLGRLPLVLGMPVMFTQNFDVESGIVNGSTGILKQIRYRTDADGNRHAISCIVDVPDTTGPPMPDLPNGYSVALEDTVDMRFTHPYSLKKCTIKRTQVPIIPAFAMTAHKSQGQTLPKVVLDLECCHGTESPYVMISRVKSLDGLLILRPFQKKRIQSRQSEDTRNEMIRLSSLRLKTLMQRGDPEEAASAQRELSRTGFRNCIGQEDNESQENDLEASHADPNKRLQLFQAQNLRATSTSTSLLHLTLDRQSIHESTISNTDLQDSRLSSLTQISNVDDHVDHSNRRPRITRRRPQINEATSDVEMDCPDSPSNADINIVGPPTSAKRKSAIGIDNQLARKRRRR